MSKAKPTGYVVYDGPSMIDHERILVVVLTGDSRNQKTGKMVQTYILRADMSPLDASKSGADYSICGTCPHRGAPTDDPDKKQAAKRSCYVTLGHGPMNVWRGLVNGIYPHRTDLLGMVAMGSRRKVRLGTYGDPSAVPSYVWTALLTEATGHTGYSHQSGVTGADFRPDMVMASADTLDQAEAFWSDDIRTFRVVNDVADVVAGREILCPASKEAGKRTQCETCGLCAGSSVRAKSIAIVAHGIGAGNFAQNVQQTA
ncbi:MAG: hypothetical protein VX416_14710 [Pseudomonadota bacterium]|nr:hypothetical protein [Pseudomonadota bacterium]MED5357536.1 hypothetical protein [Pseudomonadota bacterium]